ncbi:MAG: sodium:calcium antiporter [Planctomycetes bacterium]|nr:sodium:calcium antiporter [Planctomycetota bacterium]
MSELPDGQEKAGGGGIAFGMLFIALVCVGLMVLFGYKEWTLATLIAQTVVISIVLWQACDPFAEAAQWMGRAYHLPGSVRGATLDAVASSLPELFSGIFFVLLATEAIGESYGNAIATCAGSAIYNMILIPAVCAIVISIWRTQRPTIEVEKAVVQRDGVFFLVCEAILLICLFQNVMYWWMGVALIGMYLVYVVKLQHDARTYRASFVPARQIFEEMGYETPSRDAARELAKRGTKVDRTTLARIKEALIRGNKEAEPGNEEVHERAAFFFGCCSVRLSHGMAWMVIAVSTAIAAVACYFLVETVHETSAYLQVPTFFVAVILAAAASSLPDMFLSIGASRRGDDSGAVSNAFGSNIFDICICLSVPLLLASWMNGWQPISLLKGGEPMEGLVGLRMLLWVLTLITLFIIWHKRQVTRTKAFILIGLYCIFIAYAILGSLNVEFFGYSL